MSCILEGGGGPGGVTIHNAPPGVTGGATTHCADCVSRCVSVGCAQQVVTSAHDAETQTCAWAENVSGSWAWLVELAVRQRQKMMVEMVECESGIEWTCANEKYEWEFECEVRTEWMYADEQYGWEFAALNHRE